MPLCIAAGNLSRTTINTELFASILFSRSFVKIKPSPIGAITLAHFESNYSSYFSNYSSMRTSIVTTIVLLWFPSLAWVQDLSLPQNNLFYIINTRCALLRVDCAVYEHHFGLQ